MICGRILVQKVKPKKSHTPTVWTSILPQVIVFVNLFFCFRESFPGFFAPVCADPEQALILFILYMDLSAKYGILWSS